MPQSLCSLLVHLIFSTKETAARFSVRATCSNLQPTHGYLGGSLRRVRNPKESQSVPGNVAMVVSGSENPRQRPYCNTLPAKPSIIKRSVSNKTFEKSRASTWLPSTSVTYGANRSSGIGVGTKAIFAPPSEPDWPISSIRLSSWWLTFKKIGMPRCELVLRKISQPRRSRC